MKLYSKLEPAPMGACVVGAAPSMSLRIRIPCQCSVVSASRPFWTLTFTRSPDFRRSSGATAAPPYVHVSTRRPPRSTVENPAARGKRSGGPVPGSRRFCGGNFRVGGHDVVEIGRRRRRCCSGTASGNRPHCAEPECSGAECSQTQEAAPAHHHTGSGTTHRSTSGVINPLTSPTLPETSTELTCSPVLAL